MLEYKSMKITKFGHACLLIEEGELRILMDPGNFCATPDVADIDVILITHEHDDHCFLDSIKTILEKNPRAEIITHEAVGKKLQEGYMTYTRIQDREEIVRKGATISSHGKEHARIHKDIPIIANAGFLIGKRFFYSGDSFYQPQVPIEIIALPVSAPWMRIEEAIEYAKVIKPKMVFPLHDGMLKPECRGSSRMLPEKLLTPLGVEFREAVEGSVLEF